MSAESPGNEHTPKTETYKFKFKDVVGSLQNGVFNVMKAIPKTGQMVFGAQASGRMSFEANVSTAEAHSDNVKLIKVICDTVWLVNFICKKL